MLPPESVVGGQQATSAEIVPGWKFEAVLAWRSQKPDEVPGIEPEGLHVDNNERWCLADLSERSVGVKGVCPGKAIQDSKTRIATKSAGAGRLDDSRCSSGHTDVW